LTFSEFPEIFVHIGGWRSSENTQVEFLDVRLSTVHAIYRAKINDSSAKNKVTGLEEIFFFCFTVSY
jgi:hypothetical protein